MWGWARAGRVTVSCFTQFLEAAAHHKGGRTDCQQALGDLPTFKACTPLGGAECPKCVTTASMSAIHCKGPWCDALFLCHQWCVMCVCVTAHFRARLPHPTRGSDVETAGGVPSGLRRFTGAHKPPILRWTVQKGPERAPFSVWRASLASTGPPCLVVDGPKTSGQQGPPGARLAALDRISCSCPITTRCLPREARVELVGALERGVGPEACRLPWCRCRPGNHRGQDPRPGRVHHRRHRGSPAQAGRGAGGGGRAPGHGGHRQGLCRRPGAFCWRRRQDAGEGAGAKLCKDYRVCLARDPDALNDTTVSRWRRAPLWRWVTSWPRSTPRAQVTGAVTRVWRLERGTCAKNCGALRPSVVTRSLQLIKVCGPAVNNLALGCA